MAQVKKFALIPEELVIKHTVSNKRLSELDKKMIMILNSDLPDHEKLKRFHEVLQTSLNLQQFNRPTQEKNLEEEVKKSDLEVKKMEEENKKVFVENQDNYHEFILASLSKTSRKKAENVLSLIKFHPEILSWDSKGAITVHGEKIPNSNIVNFFNYLYNSRKLPLHKSTYDVILKDLNIPKKFLGNTNLLKSPGKKVVKSKDVPKRHVKPLIKWETIK